MIKYFLTVYPALRLPLWLLVALLSFSSGLATCVEIHYAGFPDGNVTEYETAAALPLGIVATTFVILGIYSSIQTFQSSNRQTEFRRVTVSLFLLILLIGIALFLIPWYFADYLDLDTGHGG